MKDRRKSTTQETLELLEDGIKTILDSDRYKQYLKIMAKFHSYSFGNCLLIMLQCPTASYVAGYNAWKTRFNRHVKKNERGIKIIAPCPVEKEHPDGTTTQELFFKAATVFDVEQTEGDPIPDIIHPLTGTVDDYDNIIRALTEISTVPVSFEDFPGKALGYYSPHEQRIVVRSTLDQKARIKTLVHEIVHSIAHHPETGECKNDSKNLKENLAESCSFAVLYWLGLLDLTTDDYSFLYLLGYNSDPSTLPEFHQCLDHTQKIANHLITKLKEKGIKPVA